MVNAKLLPQERFYIKNGNTLTLCVVSVIAACSVDIIQ